MKCTFLHSLLGNSSFTVGSPSPPPHPQHLVHPSYSSAAAVADQLGVRALGRAGGGLEGYDNASLKTGLKVEIQIQFLVLFVFFLFYFYRIGLAVFICPISHSLPLSLAMDRRSQGDK